MNKMMNMMNHSLLMLPTPINISYWWNYGSMLGIFLTTQILSGLFLSFHYCPNTSLAFNSMMHIIQNVSNGWIIHNIHMNGATFFFICLYTHIGRGIYYNSFKLKETWMIGVSIFFISMATAFLGYVLPWGQMSFWGATVITNLMTTIPYMGKMIVEWIWGGFSITNATLNRFFSLHFIMPFIILMLVLFHLFFLHITGSSNPTGLNSNMNKIPFHIYFTLKDSVSTILIFLLFIIIILQYPYIFSDPENFIPANPLTTPMHIQPEWYFLFAYAILRSIPNKLGGVLALLMSILTLYTLPLTSKYSKTFTFNPLNQILFWMFINNFILLTWAGAQIIEDPFISMSQMLSMFYFLFFLLYPILNKVWNLILNL